MGRVYAHWFSQNPHCHVVAFYNRTFATAETLAREYSGSKSYKTWQEITARPDIDIIGICTPSHEHLEQIEHACAHDKHILCEKPMAKDLNESIKLCRLTESSAPKIGIGFQMRFHPVVRLVDKLLPRIGDIFHLDFNFGMYRPENTWRHQGVQGGGVLKELGSHLLDLACHWAGDICGVQAVNRIVADDREVEDYSLNILEFANGVSGYLFSNYFDRRGRSIKGNIFGSQGQISWQFSSYDPADSKVKLYSDSGVQDIEVKLPADIDSVYPGHLDSFHLEINDFADSIVKNRRPHCGIAEGHRAMLLTDASYRSSRQQERIPVGKETYENVKL